MITRRLLSGICIVLLIACQEKFNPDISVDDEYLVVEGIISNRRIPQVMKLTQTKIFNGNPYYYSISGADVQVIDDLGNVFEYEERDDGTYKSGFDFLGGQEGRYYHVRIETADGEIYESEPEILTVSNDISTIYCSEGIEGVREKDFYGNVKEKIYSGMQVKCDMNYDRHNYYMFRWRGKYQYRSYIITRMGEMAEIYCRKFIHNKYLKEISTFDLSEYKNSISKDNELTFITWGDIDEYQPEVAYEILSVEDVVFEGIILEVEQHCISEKAYHYWNAVKTQSLAENRLFDPVNFQVEGNLSCVTDPSKKVFGYVGCSGIVRKIKYLYLTKSGSSYSSNAVSYPVDADPEVECYGSVPDDYVTAPF
jgi:hypothetical protein